MMYLLDNLFEVKNNGPEIASQFVNLLGVKISKETLKTEILEHPDYPGLVCISDVLNSYGIENVAAKFEAGGVFRIPVPFITQIKGIRMGINFFTIVKQVGDIDLVYFDPEKHVWSVITKSEFENRCSSIALIAEKEEGAGEKEFELKSKLEKNKQIIRFVSLIIIPIVAILSCVFALFQYGLASILPTIYLFFVLSGVIISLLLLFYELDSYNPFLQQVCSGGEKINCNAILQSKASKIFGVSWSSIGFAYFAGQLLLFLFTGIVSPETLFLMSWTNAIAVPYVFFSVYYQKYVVKQWCILCLSVQLVLLMQLTIGLLGGWHNVLSISAINARFLSAVVTAFTLPLAFVNILIPALQKAKKYTQNRIQLQRLKHNELIFRALLYKQKKALINPNGIGIRLGNPNAKVTLIKVCNPYCDPCAQAHKPMEKLLDNNSELQLQIIFNVRTYNYETTAPPVRHFLSIEEEGDQNRLREALDTWYLASEKNYEKFATKYPKNSDLLKQENKIDAMRAWCEQVDITFTPTFFMSINTSGINDNSFFQLPDMYSLSDLKYFLSA